MLQIYKMMKLIKSSTLFYAAITERNMESVHDIILSLERMSSICSYHLVRVDALIINYLLISLKKMLLS
jgi:hypothetical protein